MSESLEFKKRAIHEILRKKEALLEELKKAQRAQQESAQSDDIDLGDVAESPREQIMNEANQSSGAIDFLKSELDILKSINTDVIHNVVSQGALVQTNVAYFLIGAAIEQFSFEQKNLMGISTDAPIFRKMNGLKSKAEFHFGDTEYIILDIS